MFWTQKLPCPLVLPVLVAGCTVLGLLIGSFLNVVIHRVPKGESIVRPRSRCPGCGTELRSLDNIPIVSWLVLRGRCRTCGAPISPRYPAVELLTGVLFGLVAARIGWDASLPAFLVFTAGVIALSAIDLETYRLPTPIIYATGLSGGALLVVAAVVTSDWHSFVEALAGAVLAFIFFFILHFISPRGMGFGDVRLSALLGLFLGWIELPLVAVGLFLGFALGAGIGVVLMVTKRRSRKDRVPFGPFLAAGALLAVLLTHQLLPPLKDYFRPLTSASSRTAASAPSS
jgi:leader peptidase (prepilin peptidase)/N-methyltransferase